MRTLGATVAVALTAFSALCAEKPLSDAAKNNSEMMNAKPGTYVESRPGGVKVLFLGNSITLHGPLPSIGWTNNWGMAASAREKDFVHLVTERIAAETGREVDLRVKNLAKLERGFETWDAAQELADEIAFEPDYLIVALGENVQWLDGEAFQLGWRAAFKKMLGVFFTGRKRPHAVVRGVFWPCAWKDKAMAHAASDYAVPFVKADFGNDPTMKALGLFKHTGVQAHPGDKGMAAIAARISETLFPTNAGFAVTANGAPVRVLPIRVSAMPYNAWRPGYQRPMDQTEIAGLARVESDGPVAFSVRSDRTFARAVVRPLSKGVKPTLAGGGTVSFTVPGPGQYLLELDGWHRPLEIFVDPVRDFAKERAEANVVFGPGRHEPVVVKLKSHDRVYVDRDAVVYGSFQIDNAEDVRISGYGIISGARNRRHDVNLPREASGTCYRDGQDAALRIIDSKNVTVEGPTILDSCCWMVEAFASSDLVFDRIKVTGAWRYNTDGIDICNSQRVRIRDSFIHSFDDAIVLKGIPSDRARPVEDVRAERCVCWCGWGRTLEIGYETWAPHYRRIVFEDCDLIRNFGGALSVHLGGDAPVEDVTYRKIRIEYGPDDLPQILQTDRDKPYSGKAPVSQVWLSVTNDKMYKENGGFYGARAELAKLPHGNFRNVTIDDVDIYVDEGGREPWSVIRPEPGTKFGSLNISNVRLNGKPWPKVVAAVTPALFLDASQLESSSRPLHGRDPLNSGWVREGAAFRRQFNTLEPGLVRYGFGLAAPTGVTLRVEFLSEDRRAVAPSVTVPSGTRAFRSGAFRHDGSLRFVRIVPSISVSPKGLFAAPFRMTLDYALDEDFSHTVPGVLPPLWRGERAAVESRPYRACRKPSPAAMSATASRPAADNVLGVASGGSVVPPVDESLLTGDFAYSFSARVDAETDFSVGGVRVRDLYGFTPGIWYDFRFERHGAREMLKLNGRTVASVAGRSGFAIENRAAARLVLDDFAAVALLSPKDYPPEPVALKGEKKYTVGMNVCSLWHNGYHYGWHCVDAAGGPKPVLGYYDEGLPETADWEIGYFVGHGVDVQAFCWYPETNDDEIRHPWSAVHLRDGFKLARYSDRMKYCLIWEVMNAGAPNDLETWKRHAVPYLIEHHFKDPRYFVWEGKAVLTFFGQWRFLEKGSFGSPEKTREAFAYLSEAVRKIGLKGVLFVANLSGCDDKPNLTLGPCGFDATTAYNYGVKSGTVAENRRGNLVRRTYPGVRAIPTVSVGFDVYPWDDVHHPLLTADEFAETLKWARDTFAPDDRLFWLSTWNEYGEGTYIMPVADKRGFGYLDAVRRTFTDAPRASAAETVPTASQRHRICRLYPEIASQLPVVPDRDSWVVAARAAGDGTVALACCARDGAKTMERVPQSEADRRFRGAYVPGPQAVLKSGAETTLGKVTFSVTLDGEGVVFSARVADAERRVTDLKDVWKGDNLDLYLDPAPFENLGDPLGRNAQIAMQSDGRFRVMNDVLDAKLVTCTAEDLGAKGYTVRLVVPWRAFGVAPRREIGLNLIHNDLDAAGKPVSSLFWCPEGPHPWRHRFTAGVVR